MAAGGSRPPLCYGLRNFRSWMVSSPKNLRGLPQPIHEHPLRWLANFSGMSCQCFTFRAFAFILSRSALRLAEWPISPPFNSVGTSHLLSKSRGTQSFDELIPVQSPLLRNGVICKYERAEIQNIKPDIIRITAIPDAIKCDPPPVPECSHFNPHWSPSISPAAQALAGIGIGPRCSPHHSLSA